ncbi:MAG: exo-alpha-sialidase [Rhodothermales bacterium]|nr:exo-alpha-sialidase [Rhodothermales bacterium]
MNVRLFIGTRKGLFVASSSDRSTWTIAGPHFKGWEVTAGGRAPGGTYVAATTSFVYGPAIHTSVDLISWKQLENGPAFRPESGRSLKQIWFVRPLESVWYAGVSEAALFETRDEGKSWQPLDGLNEHPTRSSWQPGAGGLCAHSLLIDPKYSQRMWCGISAVGVFRTEDGGRTWTPRNRGVTCAVLDKEHSDIGYCVHSLAADPSDADHIYRQDHKGMYRSRDGADTWELIEEGLPSGFGFPLALDRRTGYVYAFPLESDEYRMPPAGSARVYRSTDRGESWQSLANGLPQSNAYMTVLRSSMVADSLDECGVYFGTTSGQVFYTRTAGKAWQRLPADFPRIHFLEVFAD